MNETETSGLSFTETQSENRDEKNRDDDDTDTPINEPAPLEPQPADPQPAEPQPAAMTASPALENPSGPPNSFEEADPLVIASVKPEEKNPSSNEPSRQVTVHYLMPPTQYQQFQRMGSDWLGDTTPLTYSHSLDIPTDVSVFEYSEDGKVRRDFNLSYRPGTNTLIKKAASEDPLSSPVDVARFEPSKVTLLANYAKNLSDRFLLARFGDATHLLTLRGAATADHGIDRPLRIEIVGEQTRVQPLGQIDSRLAQSSRLVFKTPQPNPWQSEAARRGLRLTRTFDPPADGPAAKTAPIQARLIAEIVDNEKLRLTVTFEADSRRRSDNASATSAPANTTKDATKEATAEAIEAAKRRLSGDSVRLDLVSNLSIAGQTILVTLSQFIIDFR